MEKVGLMIDKAVEYIEVLKNLPTTKESGDWNSPNIPKAHKARIFLRVRLLFSETLPGVELNNFLAQFDDPKANEIKVLEYIIALELFIEHLGVFHQPLT